MVETRKEMEQEYEEKKAAGDKERIMHCDSGFSRNARHSSLGEDEAPLGE